MFKKIDYIDNVKLQYNFDSPIDNNKYGIKLFTVAAFIAGMGGGKTTAMINLSNYLYDNKLISEIILISPTIYSNGWNQLKKIE